MNLTGAVLLYRGGLFYIFLYYNIFIEFYDKLPLVYICIVQL